MTNSLGKGVINLYSNVACSVLGIGNQQDLSNDLECDPFLKDVHDRKILHTEFFKVQYIIIQAVLSRKFMKKSVVTDEKIFCVYKAFDHKK